MSELQFTPAQREAIETTGRSVIVAAAAGSGKTAVLAERCAYLVCDAPPAVRCNVDELLVLTFTEAAASEMRTRIFTAIRERARKRPADRRLRDQAALCDAAQISTIHAFCLWLVRRWFTHLDVDPAAPLLDEAEARLLKREVVDDLFRGLYGQATEGESQTPPRLANDAPDDPLPRRFERLINDYGLGSDRSISEFVLRLADFLDSLPVPEQWAEAASESVRNRPAAVVEQLLSGMRQELDRQIEFCNHAFRGIIDRDPIGHFYAEQIEDYEQRLQEWKRALDGNEPAFDVVQRGIAEYRFSSKPGPRVAKTADPAVIAARDDARDLRGVVKTQLFEHRLQQRFALFSHDEWIAGLEATAPYTATLLELASSFRAAYARRKRRLGVLDFADLERFAFDLLQPSGEQPAPAETARTLHERFTHVLVDEFQDINPIQEAILRLASHESAPGRPGNLFAVGDVKQSIYRFRLAEPQLFLKRLTDLSASTVPHAGRSIRLQENFRSRPAILDAVNLVFSAIMRCGLGAADIVYDRNAALRPARRFDDGAPGAPVELHLVEKKRGAPARNDDEDADAEAPEHGVPDWNHPSRWHPVEREAYLIGARIRDWISRGETLADGRPLRPADVAVLLRATKINAERMASMLSAMNIPAYADVGGSLFGALEVRDVTAALQLLDNTQQDIPLAAVLRSGILGDSLSADDLIEVRGSDRKAPFHAVVHRYRHSGPDTAVRHKLDAILTRADCLRREIRRRPVAGVLWQLYHEYDYFAFAGGLPNGGQRRANLLKLHDLARRFSTFRRQGLARFLDFIKSLEDEGETIGAAPAIGEAEDVVRIMSIHRAKGLQFPVVFIAGLGTRFNLGDRSGRMIFERQAHVGLKVVEPDRMIEYPSAAHRLVADEVEQSTRAEELRILYVAMTRAEERLVLVGSVAESEKQPATSPQSAGPGVPALLIATARTPLDWILPALSAAPETTPTVQIHRHPMSKVLEWNVAEPTSQTQTALRRAVAACHALPPDEPVADQDPEVEQVLARLDHLYPFAAVSAIGATLAAGEFKGVYDYTQSEPDHLSPVLAEHAFSVPESRYAPPASDSAVHRGIVTHRLLQHLDFRTAADAPGVEAELQRLAQLGALTDQDRSLIDREAITWFAASELADAIRRAGDAYRREFPFIAAESPKLVDPAAEHGPADYVLVRGIADGVLPIDASLELIDFKTDAVSPTDVQARAERYRPQMTFYARALARMFRKPVRRAWLVFLHPRQMHALDRPAEAATIGRSR